MFSMIRLCAFDLDGTLLAPGGIMTERTAAALAGLYDRGIVPALISGRSPCYVGAFLMRAGVRGYVSGSNGSYIISPAGDVIYQDPFPSELTAAVTKVLSERGSTFAVQTKDAIIGNSPMNMTLQNRFRAYCDMASGLGMDVVFPYCDPAITGAPLQGILKIAVTQDPVGISERLKELTDTFPELAVSLSGPTVGDINLRGDSKGSALKRIAADIGAAPEEICCFGDYDNDLPMFREAGFSVAMGNSTPAVLEAAVYITSKNTEDGAAEAVERLILSSSYTD